MNRHSARTTLVVGGARSGKSAFAQQLCEASPYNLVYVATSPVFADDGEMSARIQKHKDDRGPRWRAVEEEIDITNVIKDNDHADNALLIDCATLWLNNLLYHQLPLTDHINAFLQALEASQAHIVIVSNEVGQGIVPSAPEVRAFRDHQGRFNQQLASACERVVEVRCGLPILLKPIQQPHICL
nr:bifunctional adenosylcobinamide kinase/adenosylcobinamide-phosphate guanylyltransferase [uncultured Cohaesibacter sp.]